MVTNVYLHGGSAARPSGDTTGKTFLQALAPKSQPLLPNIPSIPEIRPISNRVNGKIACIYAKEAIHVFTSHYQNALIGKFINEKPSMEEINQYFQSLGLSGKFQIGSLDYMHILIRLQHKEDFQNFWMKSICTIRGFTMKILKWTPDFYTNKESSIVPVWATIHNPPLQFYNLIAIQDFGNEIGTFIRMDAVTSMLTRPCGIKICVELDLLAYRAYSIPDDSLECDIEYDNLLSYCSHCRRIGHDDKDCGFLHPELRVKNRKKHQETQQSMDQQPQTQSIASSPRAHTKKLTQSTVMRRSPSRPNTQRNQTTHRNRKKMQPQWKNVGYNGGAGSSGTSVQEKDSLLRSQSH